MTVTNVGTQGRNTTLAAAADAGATNVKVASVTGMAAGDTLNVDTGAVRETRTNTPLQALTLMNEVSFVEASRCLAERMMTETNDLPEDRRPKVILVTTQTGSSGESAPTSTALPG